MRPAIARNDRRSNVAPLMIVLSTAAVALDLGFARLGYGLLLPIMRIDLGGTFFVYGAIAAWHFIGYLFGTVVAPNVMRRLRVIPAFAISQAIIGVTLAGTAATHSVELLGLLRLLLGVASGIAVIAAVTGSFEVVRPDQRSGASAVIWSGFAVAILLSAFTAPWAFEEVVRWRAITASAAVVSIAITLLLVRVRIQPVAIAPSVDAGHLFSWRYLLQPGKLLFLLLAYGLFGIGYIMYATFIVSALRTRGFHPVEIAEFWAMLGIAAMVGSYVFSRLMSTAGRSYALPLAIGLGCIGALLSRVPSLVTVLCGAVLLGFGLTATPATSTALARLRSTPQAAAATIAAVTAAVGTGQILGSVSGGVLSDAFGTSIVSLASAIAYLAATVCAFADRVSARPA